MIFFEGCFDKNIIYSSKNSEIIQAYSDLGTALIRQDTFVCDLVYHDSISFTELHSHRAVEISMVVGGYVFASDHSIPNSVSFENMTEIARLAHEVGKY